MQTIASKPVRQALRQFEALDARVSPVSVLSAAHSEISASAALHSDEVMSGLVARVARLSSVNDTDAAAVLAAQWSWLVSLPARAAWAISRVVPDVHPSNVAFVPDEDGVPSVALLKSDRYGCLASEPVARGNDAVVFATAQTLNAWWLGRVLDTHLDPMMRRLQRVSGASRDCLQQSVASGFVSARDAVAAAVPRLSR